MGRKMRILLVLVVVLLPLVINGCGSSGISGPFTVTTVTHDPPAGTSGSNSSLRLSASPKQYSVAAGDHVQLTLQVTVPGTSGHYIDFSINCPSVFTCTGPNRRFLGGTHNVAATIAVSPEAAAGTYTVRVSAGSTQNTPSPFSGDSVTFTFIVEARDFELTLNRNVTDSGPIQGNSWEVTEIDGIQLAEPIHLSDKTRTEIHTDMDADGKKDRVYWESDGENRNLVAQSGALHVSKIIKTEKGRVDEAGGLVLLWHLGYQFPSLATPRDLFPNDDGMLTQPPRAHEWSESTQLRLAAGDLNNDGHDDLIYFPVEVSDWFAVVLTDETGSFHTPLKFSEPSGTRDIVVSDIDLDGDLDIVLMGRYRLVVWRSI